MVKAGARKDKPLAFMPRAFEGRENGSGTLFCYLDEAGNFDFGKNGTDFFIMTCVVMQRPFKAAMNMLRARYDLIESGDLSGYFHASEDRYCVRSQVFSIIEDHLDDFAVYSVAVEKRAVRGVLFSEDPSPREVYQIVFEELVMLLASTKAFSCEHFIIFTDDIPQSAKRKGDIKGALKRALKQHIPKETKFSLIHQRSEGELNLQIADYFSWAVFRSIERGDDSALERLKKAQASSLFYSLIDLSNEE